MRIFNAGQSAYSDREPFARHDVGTSEGLPGIPYANCSLETLSNLADKAQRAQYEHVAGLLLRQGREQPDISEHGERVGQMGEAITLMLGGTPEQGKAVNDAGRVHDVGKLHAPQTLVYKHAELKPAERAIMERHACNGAMMLMRVPGDFTMFLGSVALLHHRNMDGTGYPNYQGEHFPLPARIIAAADRWDALRSPRSYKPAYPVEKTLQILTDQWNGDGTWQALDNQILAALTYIVTLNHSDDLNAEASAGRGKGTLGWFQTALQHEHEHAPLHPFGPAKPAKHLAACKC